MSSDAKRSDSAWVYACSSACTPVTPAAGTFSRTSTRAYLWVVMVHAVVCTRLPVCREHRQVRRARAQPRQLQSARLDLLHNVATEGFDEPGRGSSSAHADTHVWCWQGVHKRRQHARAARGGDTHRLASVTRRRSASRAAISRSAAGDIAASLAMALHSEAVTACQQKQRSGTPADKRTLPVVAAAPPLPLVAAVAPALHDASPSTPACSTSTVMRSVGVALALSRAAYSGQAAQHALSRAAPRDDGLLLLAHCDAGGEHCCISDGGEYSRPLHTGDTDAMSTPPRSTLAHTRSAPLPRQYSCRRQVWPRRSQPWTT